MELVLYFVHYALLLVFGMVLCAAFSGIAPGRKNLMRLVQLLVLCGGLQILFYAWLGEEAVWQWYPLITHVPMLLTLCLVFHRPLAISVSAIASAYLCCQPAKWLGLVALAVSSSIQTELLVRILSLLVTLSVVLRWFAGKMAAIYSYKRKSSWVFGITPVVYYLFDYAVSIYSSLWSNQHQLVVEFLPFFLCVGQLIFCSVYYREFELKNQAERKEQILRITLEQQSREVETIRRSEGEIRLLRHDLQLFLNSLSSCIENADKETARKLISGFSARAEASSIKRYCQNDTLNYVLSDYAAQCREKGILFQPVVTLTEPPSDEILFSSILANALDNALNAQQELPSNQKVIHLLLKTSNGKTLLCIKNHYKQPPVFQDDIPVTNRKGHGYGVQSIRYATEKLGGNCRFSLEEDWFVLQVII